MAEQLQPDTEDLVGVEDTGETFVVPTRVTEIEAPVRIRELPSHAASIRSVTVTPDGVQLLPRDPRRRRAVLSGTDSVQLGITQAGATSAGFLLPLAPTLPPFPYLAMTEIWAAVPAGSANVTVSILTELWAD